MRPSASKPASPAAPALGHGGSEPPRYPFQHRQLLRVQEVLVTKDGPRLPRRLEFRVQFLHAAISLQLNDLIVHHLNGRKRPPDDRFVRRQCDAEFSRGRADGRECAGLPGFNGDTPGGSKRRDLGMVAATAANCRLSPGAEKMLTTSTMQIAPTASTLTAAIPARLMK